MIPILKKVSQLNTMNRKNEGSILMFAPGPKCRNYGPVHGTQFGKPWTNRLENFETIYRAADNNVARNNFIEILKYTNTQNFPKLS